MMMIVIADFTHAHSTYVCCAHVYVTFILSNRNSIPESFQGWLYLRAFEFRWWFCQKKTAQARTKTKTVEKRNTNCKRFNLKQWICQRLRIFFLWTKTKRNHQQNEWHDLSHSIFLSLSLVLFSERNISMKSTIKGWAIMKWKYYAPIYYLFFVFSIQNDERGE